MTSIFRILILSLLNVKPSTGYDIIQYLEKIMGNKPSQGSVYPFLHELKKQGYIILEECKENTREKKTYRLTNMGKELFLESITCLEEILTNSLIVCTHCGLKYHPSEKELIDMENNFCCEDCKTAYIHKINE